MRMIASLSGGFDRSDGFRGNPGVNATALTSSFLRLIQAALMVLAVLLLCLYPSNGTTDQAQYFYDELGRLVGVVDGQGSAVV
jgi:hypothetical protein